MIKEDRRVRKTKKAMVDALGVILLQKPLKNITVREISDIADINRGTFYLHYRDVYDMVDKLENEIFEKFNEIVDNHNATYESDELFPFLVDLFNLLAENAELAKVLISKNGDAEFVDKLKNVIREKCFGDIHKKLNTKDKLEFGYFYNYIVSGCIGLCSAWLNDGMEETPSQMAEFTKKLIASGIDVIK